MRQCNGCNELIDSRSTNSLTIGNQDNEITICDKCAKQMSS